LGVANAEYGQIIGCVLRPKTRPFDQLLFTSWCRDRLAAYQIPRKIVVVDSIPRNAMGKINKKQLIASFFPDTSVERQKKVSSE